MTLYKEMVSATMYRKNTLLAVVEMPIVVHKSS